MGEESLDYAAAKEVAKAAIINIFGHGNQDNPESVKWVVEQAFLQGVMLGKKELNHSDFDDAVSCACNGL